MTHFGDDAGDYIRRRDVKMRLACKSGKCAWQATRDGADGPVSSDQFPADADANLSALYREQAFTLAREGQRIGLDEAHNKILARRALDGPDPSRKRRSRAA